MADFTIKRNDLLPEITATLSDANGAFNLTGYTVKFIMKTDGAGSAKVNAAATVTDTAGGKVKYSWAATDTDTAGTFDAEWQATRTSDSKKISFPNTANFSVEVVADLAD